MWQRLIIFFPYCSLLLDLDMIFNLKGKSLGKFSLTLVACIYQ